MFLVISLGLRAFAGLGLSAILCITSVLIVWTLFFLMEYMWPRDVFAFLWFSGIGLSAGVGTVLAWLGSDVVTRLRSFSTVSWLAIGLAAAWAAYYFETVIDPNPAPFTSREITATAILWATLGPNVIASGVSVYRQLRSGWM